MARCVGKKRMGRDGEMYEDGVDGDIGEVHRGQGSNLHFIALNHDSEKLLN